jgi:hypothetical protein
VRMFFLRLEFHQIHHVNYADPESRDILPEQMYGSERL